MRTGGGVTCVVARPGVLCTDSRETGATKRDRPKHFRVHDYLVGVAGDVGTWQTAEHAIPWPKRPTVASLKRWLYKHHEAGYCNFDDVEFLVVTATKVFEIEGRCVSDVAESAIGSGAAYALGYLRAAPDDLEGAVAAACYYDPYCSGPVRKVLL